MSDDTQVVDTPAMQLAQQSAHAFAVQHAAPASDSRALMQMIDRAMSQPGFDVDKLERLLTVKKAWEADEARKAYHAAMAEFKKNPPTIGKDKHVEYTTSKGVTSYDHATIGNVVKQVTAALSEHGISASWSPERRDGRIFVTCTLTHSMGHSQSVTLDAAADDSGGKNAIQAMGSAITYLERYTLLAITGLATDDKASDDDGRGTGDGTPAYIDLVGYLTHVANAQTQAALTQVWETSIETIRRDGGPQAYAAFKAAVVARADVLKKLADAEAAKQPKAEAQA